MWQIATASASAASDDNVSFVGIPLDPDGVIVRTIPILMLALYGRLVFAVFEGLHAHVAATYLLKDAYPETGEVMLRRLQPSDAVMSVSMLLTDRSAFADSASARKPARVVLFLVYAVFWFGAWSAPAVAARVAYDSWWIALAVLLVSSLVIAVTIDMDRDSREFDALKRSLEDEDDHTAPDVRDVP